MNSESLSIVILGTALYMQTPSEFLRSLIREKKEKLEAAELRQAIISGYRDAISGNVYEFSGDLKKDMKTYQKKTL